MPIGLLDTAGNVVTFAGNGQNGFADGAGGRNGAAEFSQPASLVIDSAGHFYVADTGNNRIREIDQAGNVSTIAGNGMAGFSDGPGDSAEFNQPVGIAVASDGDLYVADCANNRIRKTSWGQ